MNLEAAISVVAPRARSSAVDALLAARYAMESAGMTSTLRAAHLIGQCAHESAGFTRTVESLYYSTPERLMAVWPSRFPTVASTLLYTRNSRALANSVYADRMGNGDEASGDGFRYRGRGWLQLTGRDNYREFGEMLGVDLDAEPERAAEPFIAWKIAAHYLNTRRRDGKTAFEWADGNNVRAVTRIINGGVHGLADRVRLTAAARKALETMN